MKDDRLPAIFNRVPPELLARTLRRFHRMSADYGERLMEEGDQDPSLLCVIDGELEIHTGGLDLSRAGPGDLVGEMALFSGELRSASVVAAGPTTFLVLDRPGYEALRAEGNPIAQALEEHALSLLVQRLREIGDRIAELSKGTPVAHVLPTQSFLQRVSARFGGGGRIGSAPVDAVAALREARIFEVAPDEVLAEIGAEMRGIAAPPGAFLCTEGQTADTMYVLVDGLVDVVVDTADDRVEPLATLDRGDAFGLVAMVEERPRMASCIARTAVVALELGRTGWEALIAAPTFAGAILRTAMIRALSEQLAYANAQLTLLDRTREVRSRQDLAPLLRASAGVAAHGRHLSEE